MNTTTIAPAVKLSDVEIKRNRDAPPSIVWRDGSGQRYEAVPLFWPENAYNVYRGWFRKGTPDIEDIDGMDLLRLIAGAAR